jgi:hypothetical protein
MDMNEYLRVVQVGQMAELMQAIRYYTDYSLKWKHLRTKTFARAATAFTVPPGMKKRPKFKFGPKFFTKLNMMPAVSIDVRESRSHIRKTCYGFRERISGERVYLRIDPGSVVEFRDSPCGYLLGTRYLIPNIDRLKSHRWDKVSRLLTRLLTRDGIMITTALVARYRRTHKSRTKLAKRLIELYIKSASYKHQRSQQRKKREKTIK